MLKVPAELTVARHASLGDKQKASGKRLSSMVGRSSAALPFVRASVLDDEERRILCSEDLDNTFATCFSRSSLLRKFGISSFLGASP